MQTLLKVIVQDTEKIIFQGEVDRVTSYNDVGRFDVYPMHANFISIIKQGVDLYLHHQKIKELTLEQAIMKVKKNEVHIFLGIETLNLDDIDPLKTSSDSQKK